MHIRPEFILLARHVHELFQYRCNCKLSSEDLSDQSIVVCCARKFLLHEAAELTKQISFLGYSNKEIATQAHCHASTTSRVRSGGADLHFGLSKLFSLVESLQEALETACQKRLTYAIRSNERILVPFDYCHSGAVSDETQSITARAVYSNICSVLLSRPFKERQPLPEGIRGVIGFLGDPAYGMYLVQVEPTDEIEHLKVVLHELKHVEERLEDKISRLEREKNQTAPVKPSRPRLSRARSNS